MHQQTQNEDNRKPWKPSVLSIWTRDIAELPEVYPYELTQNIPSESVEPVDKFIESMLAYERFHPSHASEWLISEEDLFMEQGLYSNGLSEYIDIDKLVDDLDNRMEDW
ncbi:hypothetical protein VPLG_00246 [Vibrio phage eugene 12A10]|uniref:hypothetical protein n=1 Tax=Vibrio phage eugene 12A10 TaxID=573172 RepID=UPI0003519EA1|nr:hypothetical protein VPLG_00246 [Vibrio phage eugene 12A10]AGN51685.1 hypothetical protein VPLG_00246 [Vibrio phage eugene 12A10]